MSAINVSKEAFTALLSLFPLLNAVPTLDALVELCLAKDPFEPHLWDELHSHAEYQDAAMLQELRFALQAATVAKFQSDVVGALSLRWQKGKEPLASLLHVSRQNIIDWIANVVSDDTHLAAVTASTRPERIAQYVDALLEDLRRQFPPTVVLAGAIRRLLDEKEAERLPVGGSATKTDAPQLRSIADDGILRRISWTKDKDDKTSDASTYQLRILRGVLAFYENQPDFDFCTDNLAAYLQDRQTKGEDPIPVRGSGLRRDDVLRELLRHERMFRLTNRRHDHALMLLREHCSAQEIASIPKKQFGELHSDERRKAEGAWMAADEAEAIHSRAERVATAALQLYGQIRDSHHSVMPRVMRQAKERTAAQTLSRYLPTWGQLFGNPVITTETNGCSVLSPAAYLVDLLQFLKVSGRNNTGSTPLDVLFTRRPKLKEIVLSTENTETLLPYVDVVMEELEAQVTAQGLPDAVYPYSLPYSRAWDEVRTYLAQLGIERSQLLRTVQSALPSNASELSARIAKRLVAEALNLSQEEYALLTDEKKASLAALYGEDSLVEVQLLDRLKAVPLFLKRAAVSYQELIELLNTRFINPKGAKDPDAILEQPAGAAARDIDKQILLIRGADCLRQINRFLRIRRATGWSIQDLDSVLWSLGKKRQIEASTLQQLADIKSLQGDLGVPITELMFMWASPDDCEGIPPSYQDLYRQLVLEQKQNETVAATTIAFTAVPAERRAMVQAGLKLSAADLDAIVRDANLTQDLEQPTLQPKTLSTILRYRLLARALGIRVRELIDFRNFLGGDLRSSGNVDPATIRLFVLRTRRLQRVALSLDQQRALLRPLEGDMQEAVVFVTELLMSTQGSSYVEQFSAKLGLTVEVVRACGNVLDKDNKALYADRWRTPVDEQPATGLTSSSATRSSLVPATVHDKKEEESGERTTELTNLYLLLKRCALLLRVMPLSIDELQFFASVLHQKRGFTLGGASPGLADDQAAMESWFLVLLYQELRGKLVKPDKLLSALTCTSWDQANKDLAVSAGIDADALDKLAKSLWETKHDETAPVPTPSAMCAWLELVSLATRVGVNPEKLVEWAKHEPDAAQSTAVRNALMSRYEQSEWTSVSRPLEDALRERRRQALVTYAMAKNGFESSDRLFDELLMDVETSPVVMTSRIKQAISSVQLFIQRILLGLEAQVKPESIDTAQWEWMKNYRVWEANRKVFLYPENYLSPCLPTNCTYEFQSCVDSASKREWTKQIATDLFVEYISRVKKISTPEIISIRLRDNQTNSIANGVFVISKTNDLSKENKIAVYDFLTGTWNPWKTLNIKTGTKHIGIFQANGIDYVGWAEFGSETASSDLLTGNETQPWPRKDATLEIKYSPLCAENHHRKICSFPRTQNLIFPVDDEDNFYVEFSEFKERPYVNIGNFANGTHPKHFGSIHFSPENGLGYAKMEKTETVEKDNWLILAWATPRIYQKGLKEAVDRELVAADPPFASEHFKRVIRRYLEGGFILHSQLCAESDTLLWNGTEIVNFDRTEHLVVIDNKGKLKTPQDNYFVCSVTTGRQVFLMIGNNVSKKISMQSFNCSFVDDLINGIANGLPSDFLLDQIQNKRSSYIENLGFKTNESTVDFAHKTHPISFNENTLYSIYNWEIFLYFPLYIGYMCHIERQFSSAQYWLHHIFFPTQGTSLQGTVSDCWKFSLFRDNLSVKSIEKMLQDFCYDQNVASEIGFQVARWRKHPFDPHIIARSRLMAYQKAVVMLYLDNLIAWGDSLFQRDTIESISEAMQLYILAADLLGPRPPRVPAEKPAKPLTYAELEKQGLDSFSNAMVEIENVFPFVDAPVFPPGPGTGGSLPSLRHALYFHVPDNDKLIDYWDTVADRLYKVRHGLNLAGIARTLPLFEPAIDPAILVRATAQGVSIPDALDSANSQLGPYRFRVLIQKAHELCAELRGLGGQLLSALEKRDAEALVGLRATHETGVLRATRRIKEQQIAEAQLNVEALRQARDVTQVRYEFYKNIEQRNPFEQTQVSELTRANEESTKAQDLELAASFVAQLPQVTIGTSGIASPVLTAQFGGQTMALIMQAFARAMQISAAQHTHQANMAGIQGSWQRRSDEWRLQAQLAEKELAHLDKQIAAADVRSALLENELGVHDRQIANAESTEAFLRDKYTNQQLYDWMVGQTSAVYFQTYRLAYELAMRAERAYRYERESSATGPGPSTPLFIQGSNWDSLRKGLLAGEKLALDLRRLEAAYLEQDQRTFELTKHVSLRLHDPIAFIHLVETGACSFVLPEELFDRDYPTHYQRRIKSVALTIPCIAGPYVSVNATLQLTRHRTRWADLQPHDQAGLPQGDSSFPASAIATSHGSGDTGLFELNFHDERYLPFEGAGAISEWKLEMRKDCNDIDFDTLSDVIVRIQYTARRGADQQPVATPVSAPATKVEPLPRMFSVRHEFVEAWLRMRRSVASGSDAILDLELTRSHFAQRGRSRAVTIERCLLCLQVSDSEELKSPGVSLVGQPSIVELKFKKDSDYQSSVPLWHVELPTDSFGDIKSGNNASLKLRFPTATAEQLNERLTNVVLIFWYSLK